MCMLCCPTAQLIRGMPWHSIAVTSRQGFITFPVIKKYHGIYGGSHALTTLMHPPRV